MPPKSLALLQRGRRLLFYRKKSGVSARLHWQKWILFTRRLRALQARRLSWASFETPSGAFNSSRLYSPDGKLEANYDKHHLIPGVEPEKPGDKRVVLDEPSGHWGLQICKDMDFPKLSREYAAEGANLLLVPAWDFNLDGWLHARMALLRAVENGFALARSARNGLLTLSDNRGRILAEAATAPDRVVSVTGQVTVSRAVRSTRVRVIGLRGFASLRSSACWQFNSSRWRAAANQRHV